MRYFFISTDPETHNLHCLMPRIDSLNLGDPRTHRDVPLSLTLRCFDNFTTNTTIFTCHSIPMSFDILVILRWPQLYDATANYPIIWCQLTLLFWVALATEPANCISFSLFWFLINLAVKTNQSTPRQELADFEFRINVLKSSVVCIPGMHLAWPCKWSELYNV